MWKMFFSSSSQIGCKRRAGLELGNNLKSDEGKEYFVAWQSKSYLVKRGNGSGSGSGSGVP